MTENWLHLKFTSVLLDLLSKLKINKAWRNDTRIIIIKIHFLITDASPAIFLFDFSVIFLSKMVHCGGNNYILRLFVQKAVILLKNL